MELQLPTSQRSPLAKFIALPAPSRQKFVAELQNSSTIIRPEKRAEEIAPLVGMRADELAPIIRMFASMYSARLSNDVTAEDFAKNACQVAIQSERKELQIPPEQLPSIQADIASVLSSDAFRISAKATNILGEFERILNQARVITDLRPIFDVPSEKPVAALVVHSLRIAYEDTQGISEFFVAINSQDLEKLAKTLQRAMEKEKALRAFMADHVLCLDPK